MLSIKLLFLNFKLIIELKMSAAIQKRFIHPIYTKDNNYLFNKQKMCQIKIIETEI